jgi:hypothetical protein
MQLHKSFMLTAVFGAVTTTTEHDYHRILLLEF